MRANITHRILTVALLSAMPYATYAQATGQLSGSVIDATGASIPNARISLLLPGGSAAVLTSTTTSDGLFTFAGVRPATYLLDVDAAGFNRYKAAQITVDPARTTSVPPIKLEVATAVQSVEVAANVQAVETATVEVATTVTQAQVDNLPVLDRQVSNLFLTQAGVTQSRGQTVINGLRTSYANLTLDGVNIQDNYIRVNGLDFLPNKLTIAQVMELTVASSNLNSSLGGGAAQVVLISPSGGNAFHGSGFWYNRNNEFSANDWFNNKSSVKRPFLNLNQLGGSIGGPVFKDKLFFYSTYEAYRLRQSSPTSRTILTPDARQGIFTTASGQKFDILKAKNLSIDPAIQGYLKDVPAAGNSTDVGDRRNTIGYLFNARSNETRDNVTVKLDYNFSTRNVFAGSYIWNRDVIDRPDQGAFYTTAPPVLNDNHARLMSGSWRFNPTPTLVNELRGGVNIAPATFNVTNKYPAALPSGLLFDSPVNSFLKQGRNTNTFNLQDNASYVRGKHNVRFGYQSQFIRVERLNDVGIVPTMTIEIAPSNPIGFSSGDIPGASAADIGVANSLLASLGGIVSTAAQTFNVSSRTSGFVPGAGLLQHWSYDTHSFYVSDNWKVRPRLTLVLGLRYDYFTRLNERDGLSLLPQIGNGNFIQTLMSNATLDFAGKAVGRPYYNKDLNNFAPNIGVAWDLFGDGKTSLRAGYSISYVNDEAVYTLVNDIGTTNSGLIQRASLANLNARIGAPPAVPAPAFKVPRTFADNFAANPTGNAQGLPDPTLRTPYVQQWSLGIQRQVKGFVVEGRYIGNHATKAWRAFDYNQVVIRENGFLPDFLKAQNNGFLALNAGKGFNPIYDPSISGSQPLPFFDRLANANLGNATVRGQIQRGEIGTLGQTYFTSRLNGPVVLFNNPNGLGMNSVGNYSNSVYDGLQIDVRKRTAHGLQFQANYTYGKALTDASANGETLGFDAFMDMNNARLERARATYDLRHSIKLNHYIPLPFGSGHRFSYKPLNRVIGGWGFSGFLTLQSGPPVSVLSARGTFNRGARSVQNTVNTTLNGDQLDKVFGFFMTGSGPLTVNPTAINPTDNRGVAPDGSPAFSGQVFFNPAAGTLGTMQRRFFSGTWFNNYDFSILKDTRLTERNSIQFRADFYNLINHANFFVGDQNVNSASFGKITSQYYSVSGVGPRLIQFGLYYKF
jgi:hypothetical protein